MTDGHLHDACFVLARRPVCTVGKAVHDREDSRMESTSSAHLPLSVRNQSWLMKAACARSSVSPDLFYPEVEGRPPRGWEQRAKNICRGCTVVAECLRAALDGGESDGVWGGLTVWERHTLGGPPPRRGRRRPHEVSHSDPP
ncbi:WhiB family transcriptional regulator [Streptomyces sp. NPDC085614]|uniref:WhiB family transcriptional regulator n=1 Tax=Streptomyces sp. NPDC085614 TaxID=3365733 RepID=UPI0037D8D43A